MKPFCRLVVLTWTIKRSKHLETLKRQRLKFRIVPFQCLASLGGSIFHLSVFNPNLDLTSLAENYSSLCETSTENGWHRLLMLISREMTRLTHVTALCLFPWSSHSLTKDTLIPYHLILINLCFHSGQKQTNHGLATEDGWSSNQILALFVGHVPWLPRLWRSEIDWHNFYLTRQKRIGIKPCNCMKK